MTHVSVYAIKQRNQPKPIMKTKNFSYESYILFLLRFRQIHLLDLFFLMFLKFIFNTLT